MADPTNEILLDLADYLADYYWANGSVGPRELRSFAATVAKKIGDVRLERELLIYWLLVAYHTLGRQGWEEGRTDEEVRTDLLHVLANAGYEPNDNPKSSELIKRPPAYYLERAKELWAEYRTEDWRWD